MNITCTVRCEFARNYTLYRPYLILYVKKCFRYLIVLITPALVTVLERLSDVFIILFNAISLDKQVISYLLISSIRQDIT